MFRRKDELDIDDEFGSEQGSLLNAQSDNTVKVLSPEKAAEYKAEYKPESQATAAPTPASPNKPGSFSSPSTYSQTARPIVPSNQPSSQSTSANKTDAPSRPSPVPVSSGAPSNASPTTVASTPNTFRAAPADTNRFRTADTPRSTPSVSSSTYNSESHSMLNKHNQNERVLTVGNDILLKGEITTCDRLVIEGNVDASVSEVHTMELAQSGTFKGTAEVEFAEISGDFQGNLIVRNSLVIHRTGKVSGTITYGEIEIARGGTIMGDIKAVQTHTQASTSNVTKEEKVAA